MNFLDLKNLVYKAIGRDNTDELAAVAVPAAINYALIVIALLFKPPELSSEDALQVTGGEKKTSISSLDFIDITKVYNETDGRELDFIPFEAWDRIVPSDLSIVRFYSIYGEYLYLKTTPSTNKTLTVYSYSYPAYLVSDGASPEFDHYDSYIVAAASSICFAIIEEGESADIWNKVCQALAIPYSKGTQMREVVAGRLTSLESTIMEAAKQ